MEIISFRFLIFAVIIIVGYYLLSRKAQNVWLLAASYLFYLTWSGYYVVVLGCITLVNYWLSHALARSRNHKRGWLILGVIVNTLPFVFLKVLSGPYGTELINQLPIYFHHTDLTAVLLPVGFSFLILQSLSYIIDVYHAQISPCGNMIDFALYLSYFPKLLAGPIERARTFLPQLENERRVDNARFGQGAGLIAIGLIRKIVIADRLMQFLPRDAFSHPENYSFVECILWLILFAFALYNDFAGYTSIVRGLSGWLGIELSANFQQPFFAHSFSDFWNRWHITLSTWLRDYIFFPLRRWLVRQKTDQYVAIVLPPLVTMLVSGFWHGAYLSLLIWGGLHGVYLAIEQIWRRKKGTLVGEKRFRRAISSFGVFILATLAWIPFKASSFRSAIVFFTRLFPPYSLHFPTAMLPDIILAFSLALFLDWQELRWKNSAFFMKWKPALQVYGLVAALLLILLFMGVMANLSGFVYQGF